MLCPNLFKHWITPLELLKDLTVSRSGLTLLYLFSRTSFLMGATQTEHHRGASPSVVKVRTVKKGIERRLSSEEICIFRFSLSLCLGSHR